MNKKELVSLIEKEMPTVEPITKKIVESTVKIASRFRGSVRASTGRIWVNKEYEERRSRVLHTPLP